MVTQKPESLGTVVPGKVYGLMAAGRPLLFIGPRGRTPHQLIERFHCGWHIDCGDAASLVTLLHRLQADRDLIRKSGQAARQALEAHFDLPMGVGHIAAALETRGPLPIGTAAASEPVN